MPPTVHLRRVFLLRHTPPKQVPKMLGALRHEWSPAAMVVSFKLETDIQILLQKARSGRGWETRSSTGLHCCYAALLWRTAEEPAVPLPALEACRHALCRCIPPLFSVQTSPLLSKPSPLLSNPSAHPPLAPPGLRRHRGVRRAPGGGQRASLAQGPRMAGGAAGEAAGEAVGECSRLTCARPAAAAVGCVLQVDRHLPALHAA